MANNLVIQNIGMLATARGKSAKSGAEQGDILILQGAYLAAENGVITAVGEGAAPEELVKKADTVLDAHGSLVTPGLVDAHTHLVFGGWRADELALKLHGVPYLEILAKGGGILSSVRSTRAATEQELAD